MTADRDDLDGCIAVVGLWHLGSVTAACLAQAGERVIGIDPDRTVVRALEQGEPPISEPGLRELIGEGIASGRLRFAADPATLAGARLAWVTFDTPVDEDDHADVEWVLAASEQMLDALPSDSLVVISSQLPVGSAERLRARCAARRADEGIRVACVPENLRLGQALESFRSPERIVAGVRDERDREELSAVLGLFTDSVEWMGVESAEMTKHALNAFLATSVAFINELASVCERVGADAAEVSRGLKSEARIGPRAYLSPGDAFAGGTLARDVVFLRELAELHGLAAHVFDGVSAGNAAHKNWTRRKLQELLAAPEVGMDGGLEGRELAVWGLTYKPGTDTLRRSIAVELCRWLAGRGAKVRAHDPALRELPPALREEIELCDTPYEAVTDADALVVCTPWPDYRMLSPERVVSLMRTPIVIDPAGFLGDLFAGAPAAVRHIRVGSAPPWAGTTRPIANRA
jgi:UDPglucose 6-dehydrogenase